MSDKSYGLIQKYRVERHDGEPLKGGCIVLEFGDPNSWAAIDTWAKTVDNAGYHALAADVRRRVDEARATAEEPEPCVCGTGFTCLARTHDAEE